jgi:hypothetical protein
LPALVRASLSRRRVNAQRRWCGWRVRRRCGRSARRGGLRGHGGGAMAARALALGIHDIARLAAKMAPHCESKHMAAAALTAASALWCQMCVWRRVT